MYGRIKEQKLRTNDIDFSVQKVKNELEGSIDDENKRVNIDGAKKRAALQGMDYEGFRQMVLGAHLFTIKSKELIDLNADRTSKKQGQLISQMKKYICQFDLKLKRYCIKLQLNYIQQCS